MPQDRESGARANEYGRKTAKKIGTKLGAKSISKIGNEFVLDSRKITIHCARYRTNDIGVTYKMLRRIDAVLAAFQQKNGDYKLYEISPKKFKQNMRETKSRGNAAGKVGLVRKSFFVNQGKFVSVVKL
jgi:hypothetical protein